MVAGEIVPDWLRDLDLGTAAVWLAAGSLILAFVVFMRERRNAERSQVDLIGAWGEGEYEIKAPGKAEVVQATVQMHLRNASELPVMVKQLAYEVHTRWVVEDHDQPSKRLRVYKPVDATEPLRAFVNDVQLAPGETKDLTPREVNLAHLAPEDSRQLEMVGGVTVHVAWLLLIDTAGRRWIIEPHKGGRAKRVRRWWRPPDGFMPRDW